jgi:DNA-binding LacI/PurR family transcriptional regulator
VTDYYINKFKDKPLQLFYIYSSKSIKILGKSLLEGFLEACEKHKCFYRVLDLEGGHHTVTREILAMKIQFDTPVFMLSGSEKYTGAVLKLAIANQVEFGKDLFFCDYDNQQTLDRNGVEFTSVIQDYFEMGKILSQNLHKMSKEPVHFDVPYLITGLTKFEE